jgi:hypothetical protein
MPFLSTTLSIRSSPLYCLAQCFPYTCFRCREKKDAYTNMQQQQQQQQQQR